MSDQQIKQIRLGLDIDGVLADFGLAFLRAAGKLDSDWSRITGWDFTPVLTPEEFTEYWDRVKDSASFWLLIPSFKQIVPPCCVRYITNRYCSDDITSRWLKAHQYPELPVTNTVDKLAALTEFGLSGIVDDKTETFQDAIAAGYAKSFLVSRPWNRYVETSRRIFSLSELEWRL